MMFLGFTHSGEGEIIPWRRKSRFFVGLKFHALSPKFGYTEAVKTISIPLHNSVTFDIVCTPGCRNTAREIYEVTVAWLNTLQGKLRLSVMKLNGQSHIRRIISITCTVYGQNVKMPAAVLVASKMSAYNALNMRLHSSRLQGSCILNVF